MIQTLHFFSMNYESHTLQSSRNIVHISLASIVIYDVFFSVLFIRRIRIEYRILFERHECIFMFFIACIVFSILFAYLFQVLIVYLITLNDNWNISIQDIYYLKLFVFMMLNLMTMPLYHKVFNYLTDDTHQSNLKNIAFSLSCLLCLLLFGLYIYCNNDVTIKFKSKEFILIMYDFTSSSALIILSLIKYIAYVYRN